MSTGEASISDLSLVYESIRYEKMSFGSVPWIRLSSYCLDPSSRNWLAFFLTSSDMGIKKTMDDIHGMLATT